MNYSSELLAAIKSDYPDAFKKLVVWLQQYGGEDFKDIEDYMIATRLQFSGCELGLIQNFLDSVHLRPWIKKAGNRYGFTFHEYNPRMTYPYASPVEANKFGIRTAFAKLQEQQ